MLGRQDPRRARAALPRPAGWGVRRPPGRSGRRLVPGSRVRTDRGAGGGSRCRSSRSSRLLVLIAVVTHAPFLFFGLLVLWCMSRGPRRYALRGPLLPLSQQLVDARRSVARTASRRRPGRVARHQRLDPVGDVGRQVLAQVAQPEVVPRTGSARARTQPDQRGEREPDVEVDGLGDVTAGQRAVDQPLVGRPALPSLVDCGRASPAPTSSSSRTSSPSGSCSTIGVPCRRTSRCECRSDRSDTCRSMSAGRLEQQAWPVLQVHEALPPVRPDVLGHLPDVAHVEVGPGCCQPPGVDRGRGARRAQHVDVEVRPLVVPARRGRPADPGAPARPGRTRTARSARRASRRTGRDRGGRPRAESATSPPGSAGASRRGRG